MANIQHDIEKYLRGELTPAERHALERKALTDPFLADALEGAESVDVSDFSSDLDGLQARLQSRVASADKKTVTLWPMIARIAAGVALLAISVFVVRQFMHGESDNRLAENKPKQQTPSQPELEHAMDSSVSANTSPETTSKNTAASESAKATQQPEQSQPVKAAPAEQLATLSKADSKGEDATPTEPSVNRDEEVSETLQGKASGVVVTDVEPVPVMPFETTTAEEARDDAKEKKKDDVNADTKIVLRGMASTPQKRKASDTILANDKSSLTESQRAAIYGSRAADIASGAPGAVSKMEVQSLANKNQKFITGKVTSADDGGGLPGVNIFIKGTNLGTVTDAEGYFHIPVDPADSILSFSFIGMESQDVKIDQDNEVNVAMNADMAQLSEVVVVGYGGAEELRDIQGRIELAAPAGGRAEFKKYLETNLRYPEQALENKIEGRVTIQFTVETSGELSNFKVIRGIGYGCDEEVMRLIKHGPKWQPSRHEDEVVTERVRVRLKFRLPKK